MQIKSMMKCIVTILALCGSFAAFAGNPVRCPFVGFVKYNWQYLDTVERISHDNLYKVKSASYSIFDENNLMRWEMSTIVYAEDFHLAFVAGQVHAKNVDMQVNEYAKQSPGTPSYYSCEYRDTIRNNTVYLSAPNP